LTKFPVDFPTIPRALGFKASIGAHDVFEFDKLHIFVTGNRRAVIRLEETDVQPTWLAVGSGHWADRHTSQRNWRRSSFTERKEQLNGLVVARTFEQVC